MMNDDTKQKLAGAGHGSEIVEPNRASGLKMWVTPKVITSRLNDDTAHSPSAASDGGSPAGAFS
jgi:hypothetical protein